jgi:hypothetical protein
VRQALVLASVARRACCAACLNLLVCLSVLTEDDALKGMNKWRIAFEKEVTELKDVDGCVVRPGW